MDDPKVINKLVFDHLQENVSKKMADEFAKSVGKKNIQQTLDGIPSITHMVGELIKTNKLPNGKRKAEEMNGHGPLTKKQKGGSESDDSGESSSDEDEEDTKVAEIPKQNGVAKIADDSDSSDDEDSSEDDEKKPVAAAPPESLSFNSFNFIPQLSPYQL